MTCYWAMSKLVGMGHPSADEIGYPAGDNLGVDQQHNSSVVGAKCTWQNTGFDAVAGVVS